MLEFVEKKFGLVSFFGGPRVRGSHLELMEEGAQKEPTASVQVRVPIVGHEPTSKIRGIPSLCLEGKPVYIGEPKDHGYGAVGHLSRAVSVDQNGEVFKEVFNIVENVTLGPEDGLENRYELRSLGRGRWRLTMNGELIGNFMSPFVLVHRHNRWQEQMKKQGWIYDSQLGYWQEGQTEKEVQYGREADYWELKARSRLLRAQG